MPAGYCRQCDTQARTGSPPAAGLKQDRRRPV